MDVRRVGWQRLEFRVMPAGHRMELRRTPLSAAWISRIMPRFQTSPDIEDPTRGSEDYLRLLWAYYSKQSACFVVAKQAAFPIHLTGKPKWWVKWPAEDLK